MELVQSQDFSFFKHLNFTEGFRCQHPVKLKAKYGVKQSLNNAEITLSTIYISAPL